MNAFSIIAGMIKNDRGIGNKNSLPWRESPEGREDMKRFSLITKDSVIIMGNNTYKSIPSKYRPLPGRINCVISRTQKSQQSPNLQSSSNKLTYYTSLVEALHNSYFNYPDKKIFVIGGEQIYKLAINRPDCKDIYLTEIDLVCECDTYFPKIPDGFIINSRESGESNIKFYHYTR